MTSEKTGTPSKYGRQGILSFFQNNALNKDNEIQTPIKKLVCGESTKEIVIPVVETMEISDSDNENKDDEVAIANGSKETSEVKKDAETFVAEVLVIEENKINASVEVKNGDDDDDISVSPFEGKNNESNEKKVIESKKKYEKDNKKELAAKMKEELKKEMAAKRREELKNEKELKKQEREAEKIKREQQRVEEKRKREEKLLEEKRKREEKAEEVKRRREEVRLQKEEEKLKREEERLEAKRKREEEKTLIENEKKMKEEAKERAQSRIGNFFKKVSDNSVTADVKTDYEKVFLKFYAKDSVQISNAHKLSAKGLKEQISKLDSFLSERTNENSDDINQWLNSRSKKRGYKIKYTAVSLLQQMTSKEKSDTELQALLSLVPHKYIKFYENVRPPYIGTYSKAITLPVADPFSKEGTGYNYDYDSDLDWVDEEEGEGGEVDDLESGEEDEEDEEEDASEGEFDGFLDSEEKFNETKKTKFVGPLIPTVHLRSKLDTMAQDDKDYFLKLSVEHLIDTQPFPIDPTFVRPNSTGTANTNETTSSTHNNGAIETNKRAADELISDISSKNASPNPSPVKKQKILITEPKDILQLLENLADSTFSLGTVTEIVQKNLPHYSKQTIKNTVKEYAVRSTGKGDTPRKWRVKDPAFWEQLKVTTEKITLFPV